MNSQYEKGFREDNQRLFRRFLSMFVDILVHEIGHVFITYLSKGRDVTHTEGEVGRALECLLFGGTIHHFYDGSPSGQVFCKQLIWSIAVQLVSIYADVLLSNVARLF